MSNIRRQSTMVADLSALLPKTKFDTDKASALVALGFPAVEPVMSRILEWLQDLHWPVGFIFKPFIADIGAPLAPHIKEVLRGNDDSWKYSLLVAVVAHSPEFARSLCPELQRLANEPTTGEATPRPPT